MPGTELTVSRYREVRSVNLERAVGDRVGKQLRGAAGHCPAKRTVASIKE